MVSRPRPGQAMMFSTMNAPLNKRGERIAENRQQRIDGVAQRVFLNHPAFAQAAGAGGGDVFGAERVEQAGAHPAHDAGEVGRGEHDARAG